MKKINFVNNSQPYLSAENLNQMQNNMEEAIGEAIGEYYSTEEQVIGTWIDGKTIYKKSFSGSYASGSTLISGVETLVNSYGTMLVASVTRTIPYYEYVSNTAYCGKVQLSDGNVTTMSLVAGSGKNSTINITLEYTKKTN